MAGMCELIFQVQSGTQPLIYFWWGGRCCLGWESAANKLKIPIWGFEPDSGSQM